MPSGHLSFAHAAMFVVALRRKQETHRYACARSSRLSPHSCCPRPVISARIDGVAGLAVLEVIEKENLIENVGFIELGLVEITRMQHDGYAYIKIQ